TVCKQEVWRSSRGTACERYGGLRASPEGPPEAERRGRARRDKAEEEEERQRQGQDAGGHGDEQEERGGEKALPGQAHAGAGSLRKDAGEAANGKNPEEGIKNPQTESGGEPCTCQQTEPWGVARAQTVQLGLLEPTLRTSTDTWIHSLSTMTFPKSAGPSNLPLVQKGRRPG
ncbi:RIKEN cDNA 2510049I19, isoform CRA_c, partial [Mus musculus]